MSDSYTYINGDNGIDNILQFMSYPSGRHESLIPEYSRQLGNYFYDKPCCQVFSSNTGLFIGHRWEQISHLKSVQEHYKDTIRENKERKISVSPDLMVICHFKWLDFDSRGYHGIPKIILEFQSPTDSTDDMTWKKDIYEALGIEEYWVIKSIENVEVYRVMNNYAAVSYNTDIDKGILEIPCLLFDGLVISIDRIFMERFI